ncbi:iron-sulfur cluster assembly scaffold protein [Sphingomonas morindae]|uniref:Iron-sulfur cluster assembly scaffold protein n=1 Tax=Sphingomonas morindae TaxID=1541170 RepID=A0ABY4X5N3_9SPHN|nr:iron-sulfur cluster assembly scaffold protein [Sphingomonas morindae]USI72192.1 iron-sulfur cluster assembly scaffold protein [Sphingomonas morindae]
MSAALYNSTILRLAASIPHHQLLDPAEGRSERRSPICGSRVTVTVRLDADGRVAALGQEVRACALGQASAALMGDHAIGRTPGELAAARDALGAFLAGDRDDSGAWPGLEIFGPARAHSARHASIRLAFEAVADAAAQAAARADVPA